MGQIGTNRDALLAGHFDLAAARPGGAPALAPKTEAFPGEEIVSQS